MCESNPDDNQCIALDSDADTETLVEAVTQLANEVSDLREQNDSLRDDLEDLEATVESQQDHIDDLREDLRDERDRRGRSDAQIRKQVSEVRETIEGGGFDRSNPTPETAQTHLPEPETALEDVTALPETVVEDSLTANERRARFLAKDVQQYSRSVPAGRVIKSSEIRRVLSAAEETTVHTQTVSRVLAFLDRLGEDDTAIRERDGERLVCFSDDLVQRLNRLNHTVVAEDSSGGRATS